MGRLIRESTAKPIHDWLVEQGFTESGGIDLDKRMQKLYSTDEGINTVLISVSVISRKVYVYKTSSTGDILNDDILHISDKWLSSLSSFIYLLDYNIESYIHNY